MWYDKLCMTAPPVSSKVLHCDDNIGYWQSVVCGCDYGSVNLNAVVMMSEFNPGWGYKPRHNAVEILYPGYIQIQEFAVANHAQLYWLWHGVSRMRNTCMHHIMLDLTVVLGLGLVHEKMFWPRCSVWVRRSEVGSYVVWHIDKWIKLLLGWCFRSLIRCFTS